MKYLFSHLNNGLELVDPEIIFSEVDSEGNPIVNRVKKADLTISINLILKTPNGSKFGLELTDISVKNANYDDPKTILPRVLNRLKDFEVK